MNKKYHTVKMSEIIKHWTVNKGVYYLLSYPRHRVKAAFIYTYDFPPSYTAYSFLSRSLEVSRSW